MFDVCFTSLKWTIPFLLVFYRDLLLVVSCVDDECVQRISACCVYNSSVVICVHVLVLRCSDVYFQTQG